MDTRKALAFISYHTCPLSDEKNTEIGGMNVYVLELSKHLVQKGYKVDIYTRQTDPQSQKIVSVRPNLRVIHLQAGPTQNISKKQLQQYIPEFIQNISEFIQKENLHYQSINCHYYLSGLIGLELKKAYHLPLSITFHTLALMKNLVARSDEEKESIERIEAEMKLVQQADKVIATSHKDSQYLITLYDCPKEKILILTPGVDVARFKPMDKKQAKKQINAPSQHKLILFVGRIEPLKGIDVLLYAIKILLKKDSSLCFNLWIAGGDTSKPSDKWATELKRLEEIRNTLQITTAVTFIGMRTQEELPLYYNAADLVVLPSQYESFGITALEAMACGTPVITTDVTGVSGLLDKEHASLVTSATNPILLAQKIKYLLKHDEEYKKISQELFQKVQELSWDKIVTRYTQNFCNACK
jgi:D-inositol-3-phosphate glycosyltransferase